MTDKQMKSLIDKLNKSDRAINTYRADTFASSDGFRIHVSQKPIDGITYTDSDTLHRFIKATQCDETIHITQIAYDNLKNIVKEHGKRKPAIVHIYTEYGYICANSVYLLDLIEWNKNGKKLPFNLEFDSYGFKNGQYNRPIICKNSNIGTLSLLLPVIVKDMKTIELLFI